MKNIFASCSELVYYTGMDCYAKSKERIRNGEARRRAMCKLRAQGWTLDQISKQYRISRARVCQILGPSQRGAG